ncbi:MAG: methylated-DNA--[Abditibacteriota bacterium]|nr:methylated-DNA--[protein]-cysteine S-methyltransferase [Abditibacteriota bacterium]
MKYISRYSSPLGNILLASDGSALTGLWFEGQRRYAAGLSPEASERGLGIFDAARHWLDLYFEGRDPGPAPRVFVDGGDYDLAVWQALREIPYGGTVTYGRIARQAADRLVLESMSPRAAGQAVGRNPVSIIIPCHRVIKSDGSPGGYAAGTRIKETLLKLEAGERAAK